MIDQLKPLMGKLCTFAKDRMGFKHPPRLFLKSDAENSQMALGKTAHYDPSEESITLYIDNRHPKDILRSFAHELVHHTQNLRGDLTPEKMSCMSKNYAQDNDHMRNMEKEAYLQGNMCFRDWEDGLDNKELFIIKLAESNFLKQSNKEKNLVNIKELKEKIRQVVEAKVGASAQIRGGDSDVENEGPYIDGERAKAGIDDDGDGVPNSVDPKPKDGAIPAKSKAKKSKTTKAKPKAKKSKTTKESKTMTTKITKEFLEETIRTLLQKQLNEQEKTIPFGTGRIAVSKLMSMIETEKLKLDNAETQLSLLRSNAPFTGFDPANTSPEERTKKINRELALIKRAKERIARYGRTLKRGGNVDPKVSAAIANSPVFKALRQDDDQSPLDQILSTLRDTGDDVDLPSADAFKGAISIKNRKEIERKKQQIKVAAMKDTSTILPGSSAGPGADKKAFADQRERAAAAAEYAMQQLDAGNMNIDYEKAKAALEKNQSLMNSMIAKVKQKKNSSTNKGDTQQASPVKVGKPGVTKESSVGTPEKENALYEERFTPKNNRLFEKLVKEWTK